MVQNSAKLAVKRRAAEHREKARQLDLEADAYDDGNDSDIEIINMKNVKKEFIVPDEPPQSTKRVHVPLKICISLLDIDDDDNGTSTLNVDKEEAKSQTCTPPRPIVNVENTPRNDGAVVKIEEATLYPTPPLEQRSDKDTFSSPTTSQIKHEPIYPTPSRTPKIEAATAQTQSSHPSSPELRSIDFLPTLPYDSNMDIDVKTIVPWEHSDEAIEHWSDIEEEDTPDDPPSALEVREEEGSSKLRRPVANESDNHLSESEDVLSETEGAMEESEDEYIPGEDESDGDGEDYDGDQAEEANLDYIPGSATNHQAKRRRVTRSETIDARVKLDVPVKQEETQDPDTNPIETPALNISHEERQQLLLHVKNEVAKGEGPIDLIASGLRKGPDDLPIPARRFLADKVLRPVLGGNTCETCVQPAAHLKHQFYNNGEWYMKATVRLPKVWNPDFPRKPGDPGLVLTELDVDEALAENNQTTFNVFCNDTTPQGPYKRRSGFNYLGRYRSKCSGILPPHAFMKYSEKTRNTWSGGKQEQVDQKFNLQGNATKEEIREGIKSGAFKMKFSVLEFVEFDFELQRKLERAELPPDVDMPKPKKKNKQAAVKDELEEEEEEEEAKPVRRQKSAGGTKRKRESGRRSV
ncbi:hypothetical protein HDV00_005111 [Rhizophlyctis rosea]|nr:hypothetical protein HDV00_005111 [Rhizophlyctis rosea]